MRFASRVCFVWLLAGLAPAVHAEDTKSTPAPAASKPAAPKPAAAKPAASATTADDEFLEFLGSVDAEDADQDWLDYLAQTDIVKVAKAKKTAPAPADTKAAKP